jgi:hypothetical protein
MATKKEMERLDAILERAKDTEDEEIATRILDWATTMYPLWILKIFKKDKHLRDILKEDDDLKKILVQMGPTPKLKKCPKCGVKVDDENELIVEQKWVTAVLGKMDNSGNPTFDDYDMDSMADNLEAEGDLFIHGCEKCVNKNKEE